MLVFENKEKEEEDRNRSIKRRKSKMTKSNRSIAVPLETSSSSSNDNDKSNDSKKKSSSSSDSSFDQRRLINKKGHIASLKKKSNELCCEDIIFMVSNRTLNCIEPIVYGFTRESCTLTGLVQEISNRERSEVTKRAYIAKEFAFNVSSEINEKTVFLKQFKRLATKGALSHTTFLRTKFLKSRVNEMRLSMDRALANIDIAIEKYSQNIDIELNRTTERLNKIMLLLSFMTIVFIPPSTIGGLMGMNVKVPG